MTRTKRLLAAAAFVALPLGAGVAAEMPAPPCRPDPYAGTRQAQRALAAARQVDSAAMSARYALSSSNVIGGASGLAQRLLGAAQTVRMARQPVGCR